MWLLYLFLHVSIHHSNLSFFGINYFPPWPNLGSEEYPDAQEQGYYEDPHGLPPLSQRHCTPHTLQKLQRLQDQARAPLRPLDNHFDTHSDGNSNSDTEGEEMVTTRNRGGRKNSSKPPRQPQNGSSNAQNAPRGTQNGAQEAQITAAGGPNIQAQLLQMIANVAHNSGLPNPQANDNVAPAPAAEVDQEALIRDQTMLDALNSPNYNKIKKEMAILIKDGVKNGVWRRIKMITNQQVRRQAALILLEILNFQSMQGDGVEAAQYKTRWLEVYEKPLAKALNEQRSYVQSRLKEVLKAYVAKFGGMPSEELLLKLIKRDFALVPGQDGAEATLSAEDFAQVSWWITQVLPIAAGNQSDWGADHYLYMTVQEGHYPENARKLYVTDSTEAIGVWIILNNFTAWPAQWEAKDEHGDFPIIRKAKNEAGDDIALADSFVSHFCRCLCPCFLPTCTF